MSLCFLVVRGALISFAETFLVLKYGLDGGGGGGGADEFGFELGFGLTCCICSCGAEYILPEGDGDSVDGGVTGVFCLSITLLILGIVDTGGGGGGGGVLYFLFVKTVADDDLCKICGGGGGGFTCIFCGDNPVILVVFSIKMKGAFSKCNFLIALSCDMI